MGQSSQLTIAFQYFAQVVRELQGLMMIKFATEILYENKMSKKILRFFQTIYY